MRDLLDGVGESGVRWVIGNADPSGEHVVYVVRPLSFGNMPPKLRTSGLRVLAGMSLSLQDTDEPADEGHLPEHIREAMDAEERAEAAIGRARAVLKSPQTFDEAICLSRDLVIAAVVKMGAATLDGPQEPGVYGHEVEVPSGYLQVRLVEAPEQEARSPARLCADRFRADWQLIQSAALSGAGGGLASPGFRRG